MDYLTDWYHCSSGRFYNFVEPFSPDAITISKRLGSCGVVSDYTDDSRARSTNVMIVYDTEEELGSGNSQQSK